MALPLRPAGEPGPSLLAVLDLPLRYDLTDPVAKRVTGLFGGIRVASESGDWTGCYDEAVATVEAFLADVNGQLDVLQRRSLAAEEPNELKQRLAGGARREVERAVAEARTALQRAAREGTDRLKRQAAHVREQALAQAQGSIAVVTQPTPEGVRVGADLAWWSQFAGYLARCCEEWQSQYVRVHDPQLAAATAILAALPVAGGVSVAAPLAAPMALPSVGAPPAPAAREVEVPTVGGALGSYVRSHLMSVGIVSSLVMACMAFMPGGASGASIAIRGIILVAMLPVLLLLGYRGAHDQRARTRKKAISDTREAVGKAVAEMIERATEDHRVLLERWTARRVEEWSAAIDRWQQAAVVPRLAELESGAQEAMCQAKLAQAQLTEELNGLRMTRNQLSAGLLVDLRRKQRQLREGGG